MNKIKCYFSDSSNVSEIISEEILSAQVSIFLSMYTLTDSNLINSLKITRTSGVDVLSIFDELQMEKHRDIIFDLLNANIQFRTIGKLKFSMHHKFLIIDGRKTITGSFNWTNRANIYNMENIVLIDDIEVAQNYIQEFERIWYLITKKKIIDFVNYDYSNDKSLLQFNKEKQQKMKLQEKQEKAIEQLQKTINQQEAEIEHMRKEKGHLRNKIQDLERQAERKVLYVNPNYHKK
jgi:phosphatidylserine/phosphatidylglycerophosphate/cardiolipin synthase-like enzyme